jgi:Amt family ammonium transporter
VYSGVMTLLVLFLTRFIVGLRMDDKAESAGADVSQHRERIA